MAGPLSADTWYAFLDAVLLRAGSKDSLVHGEAHWRAVAGAGQALVDAGSGGDRAVAFAFAVLHDALRASDGRDPEHGTRAAGLASDLHRRGVLPLSPQQLELLMTAC